MAKATKATATPASAATGRSSALRPKPRVKSWKGLAAIIEALPVSRW